MPRQSAYCDQAARLTKEHVWPDCFLERFGNQVAKFSIRGQKVHGADYEVRDVCGTCNAQRLGPLDAHFCEMYDRYFQHLHDFNSTVEFQYTFDPLARALLKIAYNSARAGVSNPAPLATLRKYIIGVDPTPVHLAILVELLAPSIVEEPSAHGTIATKILPRMFRSAVSQFLGPGGDRVLSRVVGVNSFFFHLVVPLEPVPYRRDNQSARCRRAYMASTDTGTLPIAFAFSAR
jgi:hypothetical protein